MARRVRARVPLSGAAGSSTTAGRVSTAPQRNQIDKNGTVMLLYRA
jgi:hypothetical protein